MESTTADDAALDPDLQAWLATEVGDVTLVRRLVGGLTSQMLQVRPADGSPDLVVRRCHRDDEWGPRMIGREAAGLVALQDVDLPMPRLVAADLDGTRSGRATTVTTFLDGSVELDPPDPRSWVRQQAEMLVRIHAVEGSGLDPCDVWSRDEYGWLEAFGDHDVVEEAIAAASRPPDPAQRVLNHGDYQHFNLLWQGDRLSAVVDWTGVGLADRGADVGHCRLNLAVLLSADAAMQFLDDYERLADVTIDLGADLQQLLCFGDDWPEFIPIQVAGRRPVDCRGMAARVRETVVRTLRRAG